MTKKDIKRKETKHCTICNKDITNTLQRKYCIECAKQVRRSKYKEYGDKYASKLSNETKNSRKITRNEKRNKLRESRKIQGLCTECGNEKERPEILLCNECNEKRLEYHKSRNREKGMSEAGQSSHQKFIYDIVRNIIPDKDIDYNNKKTIYSPETAYPLELDIYIPSINLAIEVDGPMHREPVYGEERLELQIKNDAIKNELCLKNHINLIRINTDDIDFNNKELHQTTLSQAIQECIEGATTNVILLEQ
jgi:hypothetical protein